MSFFFPSIMWDDDDDFFVPYASLSQFLSDMSEQRMERQKLQQQQQQQQLQQQRRQCGCYQKPHKMEQRHEDEKKEEEEEAVSDSEVMEELQKRKEQEEKEKEEAEEEAKKIAEEAERMEKDLVMIPAADVVENDTHFIIIMNMPGLKKEDIHVSLEKGILTVSAERQQPFADAKIVLRREIAHGKMERQFEVPEGTKPTDVYAKVEDGVLTLTIKKAEVKTPRNIEIA